uniref:Surfactant protein C n=1 Tax=Otus sunia TaxID=257818 RepID=A0A8C8ACB7_9STRI
MESNMKQVVVEEPLVSLCDPCHHLKCLLIVVVVVVLLVVIIAGALLMWLRADQRHADTVLRMGLWREPAWEEDAATFYVDGGDGNPATVIYDYKNLLVSYRSQLHHTCYITRMDKNNIPGLDAVTETFQRRQVSAGHPAGHRMGCGGARGDAVGMVAPCGSRTPPTPKPSPSPSPAAPARTDRGVDFI